MTEESKFILLEPGGNRDEIQRVCQHAADTVLANTTFTTDEFVLIVTVLHRPTGLTGCATSNPELFGAAPPDGGARG